MDMPPSYFALGQKVSQVGHLNTLQGQGLGGIRPSTLVWGNQEGLSGLEYTPM